tara:strand:- start:176 stop:748 length:573 start_codon:yes stop_codon:yes gene_type:complete
MKIAFCIPGPSFSGWFLENWTALIKSLPPEIEWRLYRNYNPNVHVVRNQVLDRAKMFRPDYYMWIDSDINFTPDNFYKLLDHTNVSIVSGVYVMKTTYPYNDFACGTLDGGYLTRDDIKGETELVEVKANGLGWMLVKAEVFDQLDQPFTQDAHGTGEDALFQIRAKELGFRSYIDPTLVVGHEKMMILT